MSFPTPTSNGELYTINGYTYQWFADQSIWKIVSKSSTISNATINNATINVSSFAGEATFNANVFVNSSVITVGDTSVNVSINSTSFSGTSNNSSYLGGNSVSTILTYANNKAANAYSNAVTYADLAAANAYSNAISYAGTSATTNAAQAYSNAVTYADLAASNAYSNSVTYTNNKAANAYSNAVTYAGLAASNAYSNAVAYAGNLASNAYSNAVTYTDNKAANAYANANYNAGLYADNAYSNAVSYTSTYYAAKAGATFTGNVVLSNPLTIANNLTVTGTLTLSGNTVISGANNLVLQSSVLSLHTQANLAPLTSDDGQNIGIAFHYYDTQDRQAFLARVDTTGYLTYYNTSTDAALGAVSGVSLGTIQAASYVAGNATVYSTLNATAFSGTSNNSNYLSGNTVSDLHTYSDNMAANAYANAISYAGSVATSNAAQAYSNAVTYAGLAADNAYSNAVTYSSNKADNAYSNAVTYAGLAADNAYSNSVTYTNSKAANAYSNAVTYADFAAANAYSNAIAYSGNAAQAYSNATTYADNKAANAYSNAVTYAGNKADNAYSNAIAYTNTGIALKSGTTFTGLVTHTANVAVNGAIIAGGNSGMSGQFLTSNGNGNVYWSSLTASINTGNLSAQSIFVTSGNLSIGNTQVNTDISNTGVYISNTTTNVFMQIDSFRVPTGNVGQRPASLLAGLMRYNTELSDMEYANGTAWIPLSSQETLTSNNISINNAITIGNSTVNNYINSTAAAITKIVSGNTQANSTSVNTTNFVSTTANITGNTYINKLIANSALGTNGQFLTSNSTGGIYWSTGVGNITADAMTIGVGNLSIGNTTVNTDISNNGLFIQNTSSGATLNVTGFNAGNATSNLAFYTTLIGAASVEYGPAYTINSVNLTNGPGGFGVYAPQGGAYATASNLFFVNASLMQIGNSTSYVTFGGSRFNIGTMITGNSLGIYTSNLSVNNIIANGSQGTNGQILTSNGTGMYWAAGVGNLAADAIAITVGNLSIGNSTVNTDMSNTGIFISNTTSTATLNIATFAIGNSTVNTTINSNSIRSTNLAITTVIANGATGANGQILTANSTGGAYWGTGVGNLTADAMTISVGNLSIGNTTNNTDISNTGIFISNTLTSTTLNLSSLSIGNTVNTVVNSSIFRMSNGSSHEYSFMMLPDTNAGPLFTIGFDNNIGQGPGGSTAYFPQGGGFGVSWNVFTVNTSFMQLGNTTNYMNLSVNNNPSIKFVIPDSAGGGFTANELGFYAGNSSSNVVANTTGFYINGASPPITASNVKTNNLYANHSIVNNDITVGGLASTTNVTVNSQSVYITNGTTAFDIFIAQNPGGSTGVGPFFGLGFNDHIGNGGGGGTAYFPQGGSFSLSSNIFSVNTSFIQLGNSTNYMNFSIGANSPYITAVNPLNQGGGFTANDSGFYAGNSTVYISANTNGFYVNSGSFTGSELKIGNSTVNTTINSTAFNTPSTKFTGNVTIDKNLTVTGNLILAGTTTFVNSTVITTNDLNIIFANSAANSLLTDGAGIVAGTSANLVFDDPTTSWQSNVNITPSTNSLNLGAATRIWSNAYIRNIIANGSTGTSAQVLTSNSTGGAYWTSMATAADLSADSIAVTVGNLSIGNTTVNTDISNNGVFISNTTANVTLNVSGLAIGNSTVNSVVNSSVFSGTSLSANNASYLGGNTAQQLIDRSSNAYSNAIAYSGNAALAYANAIAYTNTNIALKTGTTFTGNVIVNANLVVNTVVANGLLGTTGQVLTTNSTGGLYWRSESTRLNSSHLV